MFKVGETFTMREPGRMATTYIVIDDEDKDTHLILTREIGSYGQCSDIKFFHTPTLREHLRNLV